jgi:hypothetical protein
MSAFLCANPHIHSWFSKSTDSIGYGFHPSFQPMPEYYSRDTRWSVTWSRRPRFRLSDLTVRP